jgi:hypothetical protein
MSYSLVSLKCQFITRKLRFPETFPENNFKIDDKRRNKLELKRGFTLQKLLSFRNKSGRNHMLK